MSPMKTLTKIELKATIDAVVEARVLLDEAIEDEFFEADEIDEATALRKTYTTILAKLRKAKKGKR